MLRGSRDGVPAARKRHGHVGSDDERAHELLADVGQDAALALIRCKDDELRKTVAAPAHERGAAAWDGSLADFLSALDPVPGTIGCEPPWARPGGRSDRYCVTCEAREPAGACSTARGSCLHPGLASRSRGLRFRNRRSVSMGQWTISLAQTREKRRNLRANWRWSVWQHIVAICREIVTLVMRISTACHAEGRGFESHQPLPQENASLHGQRAPPGLCQARRQQGRRGFVSDLIDGAFRQRVRTAASSRLRARVGS